jgi:hypothetical protein
MRRGSRVLSRGIPTRARRQKHTSREWRLRRERGHPSPRHPFGAAACPDSQVSFEVSCPPMVSTLTRVCTTSFTGACLCMEWRRSVPPHRAYARRGPRPGGAISGVLKTRWRLRRTATAWPSAGKINVCLPGVAGSAFFPRRLRVADVPYTSELRVYPSQGRLKAAPTICSVAGHRLSQR